MILGFVFFAMAGVAFGWIRLRQRRKKQML
jgi:hypothetical protein